MWVGRVKQGETVSREVKSGRGVCPGTGAVVAVSRAATVERIGNLVAVQVDLDRVLAVAGHHPCLSRVQGRDPAERQVAADLRDTAANRWTRRFFGFIRMQRASSGSRRWRPIRVG